MAPAGFIHISGLALMIGGLLASFGWLLFAVLDREHVRTTSQRWIVFNLLIISGGVFMGMGLPGFYLGQAERVGTIGLLGAIIFFIGIAVPYLAVHSIETTTAPNVPARIRLLILIGAPSELIGGLITGIVTFAAGQYPKWMAVGLIVSLLLGLLPQVRPVPAVLSRGVFPAICTAMLAIIGFYTFSHIGEL